MGKFSEKQRAKMMRRMRTKEEKGFGIALHRSRLWRIRKLQIRFKVLKREHISKRTAAARRMMAGAK